MSIRVQCENCFHDYDVGDRHKGSWISCEGCGADLLVPEVSDRRSELSVGWLAGIAVGLAIAIAVVAFFAGRASVIPAIAYRPLEGSAESTTQDSKLPNGQASKSVQSPSVNATQAGDPRQLDSLSSVQENRPSSRKSNDSAGAPTSTGAASSMTASTGAAEKISPPEPKPRSQSSPSKAPAAIVQSPEITRFEPDYAAIAKAHPVSPRSDTAPKNDNAEEVAGEGFGIPSDSNAVSTVEVAKHEPGEATKSAVAWGVEDGDRAIPYEDDQTSRFSPFPSRFAMVGTDIYDMTTGKKSGSIPPEAATGTQVVSPGGTKVAMHSDSHGHNVSVVLVYSTNDPNAPPVRLLNRKTPKWLRMMRFLDESRLIAHSGLTTDNGYVVWDTSTGEELHAFSGEPASDGAFCVSPDNNYMAVADHSKVLVYDVKRGRLAARMPTQDDGNGMKLLSCNGLAFSPDAKELAGLFSGGQLVVWSSAGEILQYEVIPSITDSSRTGVFQWLPDGSGWFIGGNLILDRKTLVTTWKLGSEDHFRHHDRVGSLIDQNHVLTTRESGNGHEVIVVPIPWTKIRETVSAMDPSAKPLLGRGSSVSLKFNVDQVRFEEKQTVVNDITELIRKRLAASEISLAPDQSAVIHVDYVENAGRQTEITRGLFFGGERAGVRVTSTEIVAVFELRIDGRQVWREKIDADGMGMIEGDINEESLRKAAYKWAFVRFESMAIPTRIGNDPDKRLPVQTSIH